MDTVWQHARMFGYRLAYLAYVRVYLPKRLAARFQQIHFSELELRTALRKDPSSRPVFLTIPTRTRATRANAVDDAPQVTIAADREQIDPHFVNNDEAAIVATIETLARLGVPIDEARRDHRATAVAMDAALELIRGVGKRIDDPGVWSPDVAICIMGAFEEACRGRCHVCVREMETASTDKTRGRLGGVDIVEMRSAAGAVPSLALLYVREGGRFVGWYPTLVMPPDCPTYVVNPE